MPFVPTEALPVIFGGVLACGFPGDEFSGPVNQPLFGSAARCSMSLTVPSEQTSVKVKFCLKQVGSPAAPVVVTLYSGSSVIATASIQPSQVSTSPDWTLPVLLTPSAPLQPGVYYSVNLASAASTSTSYYLVYFDVNLSWLDFDARASFTPPPGYYGNSGSPVVWVTDASGNDLTIFPFGTGADVSTGAFVAGSSYQVSALLPWLSDMDYLLPPYSASFSLNDVTQGTTLGSAPASQYCNSHGLMGLIPLQLPSPVQLTAGHSYTITINESGNASRASAYQVLPRGSVNVNPPKASFSGTSSYQYGGLSGSSWYDSIGNALAGYRDYGSTTISTQNGHGGIGGNDQISMRFVPTVSETKTLFKLKMSNQQGAPPTQGTYPAGNQVTVSLRASNEAAPSPYFAAPTGSALASATADSGTMPLVGFFDVPVSFPVTAGVPVWATLSAPTAATSAYSAERCVSPFRNLALASTNAGLGWSFFGQGPTDLAAALVGPGEVLGSPYDNSISASLTSSSLLAQPFKLDDAGSLNAVFLSGGNHGVVVSTIYPDSGLGPEMSSPLGSGSFNTAFQYFYSGVVIPYTTPVPLQAATKYWAVFSSQTSSSMAVATYWTRPWDPYIPVGYEAMVSTDGGGSWLPPSSEIGSGIFMVGVVPEGGPILTPTVLTLTAKVV